MSSAASTQAVSMPAGPRSRVPRGLVQGDQRMVFRGVDWHTYHTLSEATAEGQHFHLVYDGKDMEIVVTSNVHEHWKALLSKLISAVTSWLSIDCVSCGETTWKTQTRGLEADLSY